MSPSLRAAALSALLTSSGLVHFVRPETFTDIVPSPVPGTPHQVVYVSGAAELIAAGLVAFPRTRRWGGWATAALFVAIFPANIKMALDGGVQGGEGPMASKGFAYGRLPLQLPLVLWALRVARDAQAKA